MKELQAKEMTSTYAAEEAEQFILSQQSSYPAMRGPWLAQLELVATLQSTAWLVTRLLAKYNSVQHIVTDMVSTADLRPPDNYLVLASVGHVEHHQGGEVLPAVHGLVVHQVVHQSIQLADETDVDQSNERGGSRGSLLLSAPPLTSST